MASNARSETDQNISMKTLKLKSGMSLQLEGLSKVTVQENALFLAAIENKGIMVSPHNTDAGNTLEPGVDYLVRGFTGQYDFAFTATAMQSFARPCVYTLLSYPESINARLVRSAMRIKTSRPAVVTSAIQATPLDVMLTDISKCGSMIRSSRALGSVGETVSLSLAFEFEGDPVTLSIPSRICHSNRAADDRELNIGLAFNPVSSVDRLLLHYLAQTSSE